MAGWTRCPRRSRPGLQPGRPVGHRAAVSPPPGISRTSSSPRGSTGYPKGVAVTHANLANQIAHFAAELALSADDGVPAQHVRIRHLHPRTDPPAVGRRPGGGGTHRRPYRSRAAREPPEDDRVRVVEATPTTWAALGIDQSPALSAALRRRHVLCGGESLDRAAGPATAGDWLLPAQRLRADRDDDLVYHAFLVVRAGDRAHPGRYTDPRRARAGDRRGRHPPPGRRHGRTVAGW